jgi:hypothetical protein
MMIIAPNAQELTNQDATPQSTNDQAEQFVAIIKSFLGSI